MPSILILITLHLGTLQGVYLGEFKNATTCQQALPQFAAALKDSPQLTGVKGATLLCVPKAEA